MAVCNSRPVSCPGSILQIPVPIPEAVVGAVREPPLRNPPEKVGILKRNIWDTTIDPGQERKGVSLEKYTERPFGLTGPGQAGGKRVTPEAPDD
jgi:hypothetical protein